jgi:hypothetical protein
MDKMGRQKLVDKTIVPQDAGTMPQQIAGLTVAQALQNRLGQYVLGGYKGLTVFLDLDKLVNQPLIAAEKAWTTDRVDPRNGLCHVNIPENAEVSSVHTAEIIVPVGEVWYLCEHEIRIPAVGALATGDISVNFKVSSFPKESNADKPYYLATDPQVHLFIAGAPAAGLTATAAQIAAGEITDRRAVLAALVPSDDSEYKIGKKRDFRDGDELGTELRVVGGDVITLVATVNTAAVTGAAVDVYLRVWGRAGKRLVA